MADTGGIAALMKALNESPALGSGLKSSGASRSSGVARTANVNKAAGVAKTSGISTGPSTLRSIRGVSSTSSAAPIQMPKILRPEGKGYDPKAPKGTYVNLVI